jgi:hypothetical protein
MECGDRHLGSFIPFRRFVINAISCLFCKVQSNIVALFVQIRIAIHPSSKHNLSFYSCQINNPKTSQNPPIFQSLRYYHDLQSCLIWKYEANISKHVIRDVTLRLIDLIEISIHHEFGNTRILRRRHLNQT